jgi:ribose transport system substrate-binding protein
MKKVKGFVFNMVAVVIVLTLLAGCASNGKNNEATNAPTTPTTGTKEEGTKKDAVIGFSQGWSGITWLRKMRAEVEKAAKDAGIKVQVSDGDNKPEKQLADIEDFISKKVDVLLVSTYQAQAIAPGVKKAMEAGIPVIVISSDIPGVEPTVHLTSDARVTGQMAGEYIAKILGGKGNIIQLTGKEGSVVNKDRGLGFEDILAKNPDLKRVAQQTANYDRNEAVKVMEDLLQVHKDIQAVYAHNDEMAMGAILVLKAQGYKLYPKDPKGVVVVGVDALEEPVLKAIEDGDLAGSLRYITFGAEAVQAAVDIINGKTVEKKVVLGTPVVNKENIAEFK